MFCEILIRKLAFHYDLLIEKRTDTMRNFPVYKAGDFVSVESGPFTSQMAQKINEKIDIGKVELMNE